MVVAGAILPARAAHDRTARMGGGVDARAVYVAISRARKLATLYTDSRADLTEALGIRDGAQVGAIDQTMVRDRPEVAAIGIVAKGAGLAIAGY